MTILYNVLRLFVTFQWRALARCAYAFAMVLRHDYRCQLCERLAIPAALDKKRYLTAHPRRNAEPLEICGRCEDRLTVLGFIRVEQRPGGYSTRRW